MSRTPTTIRWTRRCFGTGPGVQTMPGIRQAIEQGEWSRVDAEITRVAEALKREATLVKEAASLLIPG